MEWVQISGIDGFIQKQTLDRDENPSLVDQSQAPCQPNVLLTIT
jgi:hypothetical protein